MANLNIRSFLNKAYPKLLNTFLKQSEHHNLQIVGDLQCGKSSLMNYISNFNHLENPNDCVLRLQPSPEPLLGFELCPWLVELKSGDSLTLSEYLSERPPGLAVLHYTLFENMIESFETEFKKGVRGLISEKTPFLFIHFDESDTLTSLSFRLGISIANEKLKMSSYFYAKKYEEGPSFHTHIFFNTSFNVEGISHLLGWDTFDPKLKTFDTKIKKLKPYEFYVHQPLSFSNYTHNSVFKLNL